MTASSSPVPSLPTMGTQWDWRAQKVQPWHLERLAVVYVRQSSPQQVLHHQESARLQYGLSIRAQELGWTAERILVIDDDQAITASSAEGRRGFQQVVSEVSLGHVGIILGFDVARVARSCTDWYRLLAATRFAEITIKEDNMKLPP